MATQNPVDRGAAAVTGYTGDDGSDDTPTWPNVPIPRTHVQAGNRPRWNPLTRRYESTRQASYEASRPYSVTASQYMQEFYDKWDDPNFQTWMMSRAIASGVNGKNATYSDYLNVWEAAGKAVAAGYWSGTPEQYIEWIASGQQVSPEDVQKAIASGEPILDKDGNPILPGMGASAPAEPVNPITNYRSTSSATINREAAYAAVDQLSQALLGRMATKAEMRKARGVMNRMLAANPTVTTRTVDQTDPNNIVESSHTNTGMSAADAEAALQMKIQRSSEGTAYTVGSMFEDAMRILAAGEG
jgi:hypothetical protein